MSTIYTREAPSAIDFNQIGQQSSESTHNQRVTTTAQQYLQTKLQTQNPLTGQEYYSAGIIANSQNNFHEASYYFSLTLLSDPAHTDALYMRSEAFQNLGLLKEAVQDLEKIIGQADERPDSLLNPNLSSFEMSVIQKAASIYLRLGNYPQAASRILKGLHQDLNSAEFQRLSNELQANIARPSSNPVEVPPIDSRPTFATDQNPSNQSSSNDAPSDDMCKVQ